jgi:Flp pilus assembly CpaE family ATPase
MWRYAPLCSSQDLVLKGVKSLNSAVVSAFKTPPPSLLARRCNVAFAEAAASGSTVLETEPESLAAREITSLVREIMEVGA